MKGSYERMSQLFLTNRDWIIIYSAMIAYAIISIQLDIGSKWFVLYVIARFEGESISLSSMMVAILELGGIFGVKVYNKCVAYVQKLIYNGVGSINSKQEIIINPCILLIFHSVLAIVSFIWK